nr:Pycsar system effector family protein [Streptomyces sp. BA2]
MWAGIFLIMAGALCAITVVAPRLRSRKQLQAEAPNNFIYFGTCSSGNRQPSPRSSNNRTCCQSSATSSST